MKKIFLICLTAGITQFANAVPNFWESTSRQDTQSLSISSDNNSQLTISCHLNEMSVSGLRKEILVEHNGNFFENSGTKNPLSFLINDTNSFAPQTSNSWASKADWNSFLIALPSAKKIEVYNNNKFLFTLNPRNSNTGLDDLKACLIN